MRHVKLEEIWTARLRLVRNTLARSLPGQAFLSGWKITRFKVFEQIVREGAVGVSDEAWYFEAMYLRYATSTQLVNLTCAPRLPYRSHTE